MQKTELNKDDLLIKAQAFMKQGLYEKAAVCGDGLLARDPKDCEALYILAMAQMHLGEYDQALNLIQRLKQLDINYVGAYMTECYVYKKQGRFLSAEKALQALIVRIERLQAIYGEDYARRSLSEAWSLLGSIYTMLGKPQDALQAFLASSSVEQEYEQKIKEYSNALFVANYIENLPVADLRQLHKGYQEFYQDTRYYYHFVEPGKKLRIGYISPDFRQHPVAFLISPLLKDFSADKFEVYCYAANMPDAVTVELQQQVTCWKSIMGLSADQAARMIYEDDINILVDLSGHTQNNCLPVLARKPAPVQLSGIGYFNTTGLAAVDYFLTDVYCDPVEDDGDGFTEDLLRLPHSHFCYKPVLNMPNYGLAPCKKNGYITFASFNNFSKVTDSMLALWRQILSRVKQSRLILKSRIFDSEEGRAAVCTRLDNMGYDLKQIELRGFSEDYLKQYNDVDIALDTYPYTGGITTCEALYMGVPVVTLCGNRHGARFGASLLQNAGLAELIAADEQQYVEKAVAIARDPQLIEALHLNLRHMMQGAALMNKSQYVKELETAYAEIWEKYLYRQGAENINGSESEIWRQDLWQCIGQGDFRQAEAIAQIMLKNQINTEEVLAALTSIYIETNQIEKAQSIVIKLAKICPREASTLFLQARVAHMLDNWQAAVEKCLEALKTSKDLSQQLKSQLYNLLGSCYKNLGQSCLSAENYFEASRYSSGRKDKAIDYSNYLFNLHYQSKLSADIIFDAHKKYNELFSDLALCLPRKIGFGDKIRIGYISPDMRYHVVMAFSKTLLMHYDRNLFEVTCYAKGKEDLISEQIKKQVDHWCNISAMDDKTVAGCIYKDGIDILVDLAGHTKNNCLPVLAYKPAPIQISGIGYFNTTGLATVDYFLTDSYTTPAGLNTSFFTEKPLCLPHSHFCYQPLQEMPECASPAFLKNKYITFGSFNNFSKVTDEMIKLWGEILTKVPKSQLILKSRIFNSASGKAAVAQRFAALGMEISRIEMRPETRIYLGEYADIDIALDTYPYQGGGTTCEALYMGVPVITLVGKQHRTRFGYSLLMNIGLGDCCAETEAAYIETAVNLAGDKKKLIYLHQTLRQTMRSSPLMDVELYMRDVEKMFLTVWEKRVREDHQGKAVKERLKELVQTAKAQEQWQKLICYLHQANCFTDNSFPADTTSLAMAYFSVKDYRKAVFWAEQALSAEDVEKVKLQIIRGESYRELLDYVAALQAFLAADDLLQREDFGYSVEFSSGLKTAIAHLQNLLGYAEASSRNYLLASAEATDSGQQRINYSSYLLSLHYRMVNPVFMYQEHIKYQQFFAPVAPYRHIPHQRGKKLHVGYISPDFHQHVMFYFYHQLLACYNKEEFSVSCYSLLPAEKADQFTLYLRGLVDNWRDIAGKTNAEIAAQIYEDRIDILFDLAGHAADSGLPVLAYKPAPLQISGLGYVNTTGLPGVDYFVTDKNIDPEGCNDNFFTEKLLRLPKSQFCYTGRSDVPVPQGAPCYNKGYITFASFNHYVKITDEVLEVWLTILAAVDKSRLLLKSQVFVSSSAIKLAKERLCNLGYDLSRVDFAPATDTYMEDYLSVDIALDTYPYPGGGTTCDALYMGVPVVAMYGKTHGSRFGYSILKNIGLEDLAVQTEAEYVAKAVALAEDWELLDLLHKQLRDRMLQSPLMDEQHYVKEIENIYKKIWQETEAKLAGNIGK